VVSSLQYAAPVPVLNLSFYRYDVKFVGTVLPGDELTVKLRHIGMRDGNIVVNIETSNARGDKVIQGSAEVSQSSTVYVFTGQELGMGMDLYNSSPVARAVWEVLMPTSLFMGSRSSRSSRTTRRKKRSTSAVSKVRPFDNATWTCPTTQWTRTAMSSLPLFADIDVRCPKYTFSHPGGLLFATQFAQVALSSLRTQTRLQKSISCHFGTSS
jgi:fatty acid synthase subunit alpha